MKERGLYDLFRESTIVQGLITLCLVATYCIMLLNNQRPNNELYYLVIGATSFYLGGKVQDARLRAIMDTRRTQSEE